MVNFVKVLITVVIFGALITPIVNSLYSASQNGNLSTAGQTIIALGGLFVAIGLIYVLGKQLGVKMG